MYNRYYNTIAALLFVMVLTQAMVVAKEAPSVTLDSLAGTAEVQRAGQRTWTIATRNMQLYNNDVIRVLSNSLVRITWEEGNQVYIHSNSQICINLLHDSVHNSFSRYTTIFFGAVYFVIKKTLPRKFTSESDNKVYTPTASIAIRGTSFSTHVNKDNGQTQVGVINGTVLVKNILKSQQLFLSAGFKTDIALTQDPLHPSPLLDDDIKNLKAWVPPPVIAMQMKEQNMAAKRDFSTITGKLEKRIVLIPVVNSSEYIGTWNISEVFTAHLRQEIQKQNRISCTTATIDEKSVDPIALGARYRATYVITGEVRKFDIVQKAEVSASADKYREYSLATVCLDVQLINTENKTVIFQNTFCGEITAPNAVENTWNSIRKLPFTLNDSTFANSILGKAVRDALNESASQLSGYISEN